MKIILVPFKHKTLFLKTNRASPFIYNLFLKVVLKVEYMKAEFQFSNYSLSPGHQQTDTNLHRSVRLNQRSAEKKVKDGSCYHLCYLKCWVGWIRHLLLPHIFYCLPHSHTKRGCLLVWRKRNCSLKG